MPSTTPIVDPLASPPVGPSSASFAWESVADLEVVEFVIPSGSSPFQMTIGADGNVWFSAGTNVGKITAAGVVTEFAINEGQGSLGVIGGLMLGADGAVWFTQPGTLEIGMITVDGVVTEVPVSHPSFVIAGSPAAFPHGIVQAVDDSTWITGGFGPDLETNAALMGRLDPTGQLDFVSTAPVGSAYAFASGPDGYLWLAGPDTNFPFLLGLDPHLQTTPDGPNFGGAKFYPIPATSSRPTTIVTGPDDALWFTDSINDAIWRMDLAGAFTQFDLPETFLSPHGLAVGHDGNLWFTDPDANEIGVLSPTGALLGEFDLAPNTNPLAIIAGADGAIWYTAAGTARIGRIGLPADNQPPVIASVQPQFGEVGQAATLAISASDPDDTSLSFAATGLPAGLTIHSTTGVITGRFAANSAGIHGVTVTVSDPRGGSASTNFVWFVTDANAAPNLFDVPSQIAREGDTISLQLVALDPEGGPMTYQAFGLPPGLTLDPNTGLITGTISAGSAGDYQVVATVYDDHAFSDSTSFAWTVLAAPALPSAVDRQAATFRNVANVVELAFEPLPDGVVVELVGAPTWGMATIVGTSVSFTPDGTHAGPITFGYRFTDGSRTSNVATVTIDVDERLLLAPGQSGTDAHVDRFGTAHPATVSATNHGPGAVLFHGADGVAFVEAYSGDEFHVVVAGLDGHAGDVEWTGNAEFLRLEATGSVESLAIAGQLEVFVDGDLGHVEADVIRATAGGNVDTVVARQSLVGLNAGGDVGSITVGHPGEPASWETPSVPRVDLDADVLTIDWTRPVRPLLHQSGSSTGDIIAAGNVGGVTVFGGLAGLVSTGGTLGRVWASAGIDAAITVGQGGANVETWGTLAGSIDADGDVVAWAYDDLASDLHASGAAKLGSWANVTGGVRATTSTGFALDSFVALADPQVPDSAKVIESKGDNRIVAGGSVERYYVVSTEGSVTIDAKDDVRVTKVEAAKNVWIASRSGSIDVPILSAHEGWAYLWATRDIAGAVHAKQTVSATAWNDLKANLTSSEGVEAFAGRHVTGAIEGRSYVDLEARGNVVGGVKGGDATTFADVVVRAGGDLVGNVGSTGNADVAVEGNVRGEVRAAEGWLNVVANGDVKSVLIAGAEAEVWAGGNVERSVFAGADADVRAGGHVMGDVSAGEGDAAVHAGGDVRGWVTSRTGNIFIEAAGAVTSAIVRAGKDVSIVANGNITGYVEADWLADVRSSAGEVTAEVTTRKTAADLATAADSPTKLRLAAIDSEITALERTLRNTRDRAQRATLTAQIAELQAERALHTFGQKEPDWQRIDADAIRDLLNQGLAVEHTGEKVDGYPTSGYVVVVDVIGTSVVTMLFEPMRTFQPRELPIPRFPGTPPLPPIQVSLLGKPNATKQAETYRLVNRISSAYAGTPDQVRSRLLTAGYAKARVETHILNLKDGRDTAIREAVEFGIGLVPLVGTANEFAKGNYLDGAISLAGDATLVLGLGAAIKARQCVYAGVRAVKFTAAASAIVEGSVVATRLGQGFHALGGGQDAAAWGYFGDATLRLMGLSAQGVAWLRKPKCFVAGTLVHAEHGTKAIEDVRDGERVWAFDRQRGQWRLAAVLRTFERTSELLTTVRFDDGIEITGTEGHPFWVIEGDGLASRAAGDHGADEPVGRTPGRWVAMGDLRPGDVVLSRESRTRRVVEVETRRESQPVYNLEVEGLHAYAVGESGILVHNATGYTGAVNNLAKESAEAATKPAVAVERAGMPEVSAPVGPKPGVDAPATKTGTPSAASAVRDELHQGRPRSNSDPRVTHKSRADGRPERVELQFKDQTEEYYKALDEYNEALSRGTHTVETRDAGERLGRVGAEQYMENHLRARQVYSQTAAGGQFDLDMVYKKGDTYYVVEAKGKSASATPRQIPGQTLPTGGPAYAMEGSEEYLRITLQSMSQSGDPARETIARELNRALATNKVVYLQVSTRPRANGTAYFSVIRFLFE